MLDLGTALLAPAHRVNAAWQATRRTALLVPNALEAVLTLPRLSQQLEVISSQTSTLLEIHAELVRVRQDTAALPQIDETLKRMSMLLDRVDANTAAVEQMAEVMMPLQSAAVRVGRIADRWPARDRSRP